MTVFSAAARVLRIALFAVATLVAVVWCLQNQGRVLVSFLPFAYGIEMPLFLLVLLIFCLGFALACLLAWPRSLRLRRQLRLMRQRLDLQEHDVRQGQLHRQLAAEMRKDEDDHASVPMVDDERHLPV